MSPDEKVRLENWISSCNGAQKFGPIQSQILLEHPISLDFLKGVFDCFPNSSALLNQYCECMVSENPWANKEFTKEMIDSLLGHIKNDLREKTKAKAYFSEGLAEFIDGLKPQFSFDPNWVENLRNEHDNNQKFTEGVFLYLQDHWIGKERKYVELYKAINAYFSPNDEITWLLMAPLQVESGMDFTHHKKFDEMGGVYAFSDTELFVSSWLVT